MQMLRCYPQRKSLAIMSGMVMIAFVAACFGAPTNAVAGTSSHLAPSLGPNVYIFNPSMSQSDIQSTVNSIANQQISNQFGTARYALLFEPGTYGTSTNPLTFQVGYYTTVAGLGQSPTDVVINGTIDVYNQCFSSSNCIALDNFWRSLSNLTINIAGQSGCFSGTEFWAVSQAAPLRRVNVTGGNVSFMDYCNGSPDYASGGFVSDSQFTGGSITNGSQQQFLVRNSAIDGWSNGVWNQVFSGVIGAPAQSFGESGGAPYTTLATSPVTREAPYLYIDSSGNYDVFVPAVQTKSLGPTWTSGPTPGKSIPLTQFFIARPSDSVAKINAALASGMNLLLTPGVYNVATSIKVTRLDTVVLGIGFPTLIADKGAISMVVKNATGIILSGMIFDAGATTSPALLEVGTGCTDGSDTDPSVLSDIFFRIGGAEAGSATNSLIVEGSYVILDDIWAWRADHGTGVGWTSNTANTGLIVNGNNVTAYGLFIEHYQQYQVIWNGNGGTEIFFQNEMPYDPPSQAAWMEAPGVDGWAAFKVADSVTSFNGYGMGSYSFFDQGVAIYAANAFEVPANLPAGSMQDLLTVFLSGSGGILNVIDNTGGEVDSTNGGPNDVVSFPSSI